MKNWLIALPLLFALCLAKADVPPPPSEPANTAATPTKAMYTKSDKHRVRHLPRGDLRYCLKLKDNEAIIRCAETGRKR
jgi:hypothetical protein